MSVHIEWGSEERRVILWSFIGRWTWGEFDDAIKTVQAMVDSISYPVDLICDVRQMSILPPDIVKRFKENYLKKAEKIRNLIFVGMDADLQLFWNTFTDLPYAQHLKAYYFDTPEEAYQFSMGDGKKVVSLTHFTIATPPDFRYQPTVLSHGWCVLHPFSYDEAGTLSRVQKLRDGQIVHFDVRADPSGSGLAVSSEAKLSRKLQQEISAIVGRVLSFDHDLTPFHDLIRAHPTYGWIETAGAGRMLVSPTVWEDLAKTLLTTNTTWAMTKSMVARLVTLGDVAPDGTHVFPEPAQIAAFDPEALNQQVRAGYRGAYLHELAIRIASGELDVEAWRDPALSSVEVYKALKRLKGFGDYAAGAMMRLLGRFDQLGLDSVCRTMYAQRYNAGVAATDREIAAFYEPFGAWRGLVVWMDVMREDILS